MQTQEIRETVDQILLEHNFNPSSIISILQGIQKKYRYLPEEAINYVSERLDVSSAKIYGVATFYENFSLEPKGKHIIKVCDGTACHIRKSQLVLDGLRKELNLTGKSKTTEDMLVTLEQVSCLGACSLAPVLNVDDDVHARMTPAKVQDLVKSIREGEANKNQN